MQGLRWFWTLFAISACSVPTPEPAPEELGPVTLYQGARLIVGDGQVIESSAFTVDDDGRFLAVGSAGELAVPEGANQVDLTGMTVIPAIVDAHTHLSTSREALIEDLERRAYYGVGAAMSLGIDGEETPLEMRDESIPGAARYRSAGRGITSPEPGRSEVPHWVTTEEEARQGVRDELARDVDIIKIWVDDRNGQYEKLGPELYGAVIDEAHQHDLRVTAHIFSLEDAKGLLRAGIDAFAHGVRDRDVDEELVALVKERPNVVLVPNMPDRGVPAELDWLSGSIPPDELAELKASAATERPEAQAAFAIQARNLARLNEVGMRIALGTDGNTPWAPHVEMEDMVASGMTPAEVLVAATRNAAEVAGLAEIGLVAPGKSADFVVLEANPLDDITNSRRISAVYLRGVPVDRDALSARWTGPRTE
jgi:imidazolonepropionase-like amidohydrolase